MQAQTITQKFQTVLDSQGLDVRGLYFGNRRMGIFGSTREVARALSLIGQIYAVDSITELDDDRTAATVLVPDTATAKRRFDIATNR